VKAKDWKYLDTEAFRTRQALAAYFVSGCANIFEVGCHKNPIYKFLAGPHERVICADPLIDNPGVTEKYKRNGRMIAREITAYIGNAKYRRPESLGGWGLVVLGYDPRDLDLDFFLGAIEESEVAVFECWESYTPWKMLKQSLPRTGKEIAVRIRLNLEGNDVGDLSDSWPPRYNRELLVLK